MNSPYHFGERHIQQQAGEVDSADRNGTVITDSILPGAIPFIAQQSLIIASTVDEHGKLWASTLIGEAGFLTCNDKHSLTLDGNRVLNSSADPFWANIDRPATERTPIGILAIELATRRRFRINGNIRAQANHLYCIEVEQAYPNCPKYIQRRNLKVTEQAKAAAATAIARGHAMNQELRDLIATADSFFIASANPAEPNSHHTLQCDASHRGGNPGFIEVLDEQHLRIPDYAGNSMFNTLGNIHSYPRAGLVFIDFENKHCLQFSGNAEVLFDQDDHQNRTGGTQRFWQFSIASWQLTALPEQIEWQFGDYSPHNPKLKKTAAKVPEFLELEVTEKIDKSDRISLFRLQSQDRKVLPEYDAGAHLPVSATLENGELVERYYSLISNYRDDQTCYEVAVQREDQGRGGSRAMHRLAIGSGITTRAPKNHFPLEPKGTHTILIAGGIGITPMLAMAKQLVQEGASFEFHYAAQSHADMAFYDEVKFHAGDKAQYYYSKGFHGDGHNGSRINLANILQNPSDEIHLFTCGPNRLIDGIRTTGEECGWNSANIHFESFGPTSASTDTAIEVTLAKSGAVVQVDPKQTILDALIEAKVNVAYDCKRGECGMCATSYTEGEVDHRDFYLNNSERHQQLCVCVSRTEGGHLTLDI